MWDVCWLVRVVLDCDFYLIDSGKACWAGDRSSWHVDLVRICCLFAGWICVSYGWSIVLFKEAQCIATGFVRIGDDRGPCVGFGVGMGLLKGLFTGFVCCLLFLLPMDGVVIFQESKGLFSMVYFFSVFRFLSQMSCLYKILIRHIL